MLTMISLSWVNLTPDLLITHFPRNYVKSSLIRVHNVKAELG